MKKQLGVMASLLFLCVTALTWAGSPNRCCEPCPPQCRPAPVCRPVCPPQPVCKPVCAQACPVPCEPFCKILPKCRHPNQSRLECYDFITVTGKNPGMCMLGDQYPLEFLIHACADVCDVRVTTTLPEGVSYIRSQPEAKVEGRKLIWEIGGMEKDECINAKVWVKCECEGEQCACFCATATPVRFCSLLCAKPLLTCEKCGDEEVCLGDPVRYKITVSNRGSCTAEDVVVTDQVPDGLEHSSGLRTLVFKLGCLEPCQTKQINLSFCSVKRGRVCNTALVTACNADSTSCQACTNISLCGCEITKVGPKEQMIGKNADYQITLTNPGDRTLHDIVVTDLAPSSTSIVAANGATINGQQAVWRMRELKGGEKASFTITLTTCTPGCFTNRVSASNCEGYCCNSEFTTRWRGRPSLHVCISNPEEVCVGETTSYSIVVDNQGSEPDSNVLITVRFPSELQPVAATGDLQGKVSGQTVTYGPINNFAPRQKLNLRVDAVAKAPGDARVNVEVTSDSYKVPIVSQESTIIN